MCRFVLLSFFGLYLFASAPFAFAQTEGDAERRARLEQELQVVERQILTQQRLVEDKQLERRSLERDVALIEGEIKQAQLGIQARSVAITQLSDQIGEKEVTLSILEEKLGQQRDSLSDLVRKSVLVDDFSLVEVMLSRKNFSEFFSDVATYQSLKDSLNQSLTVLHGIQKDTYNQKDRLLSKQYTEAEMKKIQELQKGEIEKKEKQKESILTVTKGEERSYQVLLDSQKRTASQLRNALFQLLGGGGAIPLPEAIRLAQAAGKATGIDAAMILAILQQETELGSNLGRCLFTDKTSGRPVMHPDRDEPLFLAIAQILGFDPYTRTVSCPAYYSDGTRYGWGGAMGPSQFIPSTWAYYGGIVKSGDTWVYSQAADVIRRMNGTGMPANPFNNQDAFLATALLLRDNGADGTHAGDRIAALRYYAGWGGATRPENAFYGNSVMRHKATMEENIRILGGF